MYDVMLAVVAEKVAIYCYQLIDFCELWCLIMVCGSQKLLPFILYD